MTFENQRRQIKQSVRKSQRTADKIRVRDRGIAPPLTMFQVIYDDDLGPAEEVDTSEEFPAGISPTTARATLVTSTSDTTKWGKQQDNSGQYEQIDVTNYDQSFSADEDDLGFVVLLGDIFVPVAGGGGSYKLVRLPGGEGARLKTLSMQVVKPVLSGDPDPSNVIPGMDVTFTSAGESIVCANIRDAFILPNIVYWARLVGKVWCIDIGDTTIEGL